MSERPLFNGRPYNSPSPDRRQPQPGQPAWTPPSEVRPPRCSVQNSRTPEEIEASERLTYEEFYNHYSFASAATGADAEAEAQLLAELEVHRLREEARQVREETRRARDAELRRLAHHREILRQRRQVEGVWTEMARKIRENYEAEEALKVEEARQARQAEDAWLEVVRVTAGQRRAAKKAEEAEARAKNPQNTKMSYFMALLAIISMLGLLVQSHWNEEKVVFRPGEQFIIAASLVVATSLMWEIFVPKATNEATELRL
jgi:hypothetical protein